MTSSSFWRRGIPLRGLVLGAALAGCQPSFDQPDPLLPLDEPYFRCHVQPLLTKSCAMLACHGADGTQGTSSRYYRVYARNRLRLGKDENGRNAQLSSEERAANFTATRGLIDAVDPTASVFLLKPLEQQAGGLFHRGAELFGPANVYATTDDPDFVVLRSWVQGKKEVPTCIEPGSDQ